MLNQKPQNTGKKSGRQEQEQKTRAMNRQQQQIWSDQIRSDQSLSRV